MSIFDTYIGYGDYIAKSPEPLNTKEVVYVFVKGSGWVPETPHTIALQAKAQRQAAKAANFGTPWRDLYGVDYATLEANIYDRIRREERERARNELMERAVRRMRETAHNWVIDDAPVFVAPPPRRAYTTQMDWYTQRTAWNVGQRYFTGDYNQRPVVREPAAQQQEVRTQRYYPGSGERAEAVTPNESQHARRMREWQEARERARRGR